MNAQLADERSEQESSARQMSLFRCIRRPVNDHIDCLDTGRWGSRAYCGENEGMCLAASGGSRTDPVLGVDWCRSPETNQVRRIQRRQRSIKGRSGNITLPPRPRYEFAVVALATTMTSRLINRSCSRNCNTRRLISSRVCRTDSIPCPLGSGSGQSSRRRPGIWGQSPPKPIVMSISASGK
jgi:hypothetical protein